MFSYCDTGHVLTVSLRIIGMLYEMSRFLMVNMNVLWKVGSPTMQRKF